MAVGSISPARIVFAATEPRIPATEQPTATTNESSPITGTGTQSRVGLTIPLDGVIADIPHTRPTLLEVRQRRAAVAKPAANQRDSLVRRESFLRGKEGSRRRQRWENDHFLHNPHAVPPTKADWEVRPVYPRRNVPYQYALLWEHPNFLRRKEADRIDTGDKLPKDLKIRLKKARGAISLLETLEKEVRDFILSDQNENAKNLDNVEVNSEEPELIDVDSEEEIVFISKRKKNRLPQPPSEKVMLESLADDSSASFGRWLIHCIAGYYGLRSWSITRGNPAMRYAYVAKSTSKSEIARQNKVPKPLYMML